MDWQWILAITTVFLVISGLVDGINGYQWRSFFSKTNQVTKLFGKPQGLGWWSPITRALNGGESVKKRWICGRCYPDLSKTHALENQGFLQVKMMSFSPWWWWILWLKHEFLQKIDGSPNWIILFHSKWGDIFWGATSWGAKTGKQTRKKDDEANDWSSGMEWNLWNQRESK